MIGKEDWAEDRGMRNKEENQRLVEGFAKGGMTRREYRAKHGIGTGWLGHACRELLRPVPMRQELLRASSRPQQKELAACRQRRLGAQGRRRRPGIPVKPYLLAVLPGLARRKRSGTRATRSHQMEALRISYVRAILLSTETACFCRNNQEHA